MELILSSFFLRGLSSIFVLFYYSLLFLKFERGVATPLTPLLDPPMESVHSTHNEKDLECKGW